MGWRNWAEACCQNNILKTFCGSVAIMVLGRYWWWWMHPLISYIYILNFWPMESRWMLLLDAKLAGKAWTSCSCLRSYTGTLMALVMSRFTKTMSLCLWISWDLDGGSGHNSLWCCSTVLWTETNIVICYSSIVYSYRNWCNATRTARISPLWTTIIFNVLWFQCRVFLLCY